MKRTITPGELKERPSDFTVVDVRRKTDYDGNAILNAEWHNPDDVGEWAKSLPTDKRLCSTVLEEGLLATRSLIAS